MCGCGVEWVVSKSTGTCCSSAIEWKSKKKDDIRAFIVDSEKTSFHGKMWITQRKSGLQNNFVIFVFVQRKSIIYKKSTVAFSSVAVINLEGFRQNASRKQIQQ